MAIEKYYILALLVVTSLFALTVGRLAVSKKETLCTQVKLYCAINELPKSQCDFNLKFMGCGVKK